MSNKYAYNECMTTRDTTSAIRATRVVIEKGNKLFTNGIAETGKSNSNTYAMRDYSRKATKDNTPVRYITRVGAPDNVNAWLIANAHNGAMVRTLNGATHYEIGHAVGVWDNDTQRAHYPLMPKGSRARRGVRGVSVERALSIYDNE
jgi:predicted Zn-dependent protease